MGLIALLSGSFLIPFFKLFFIRFFFYPCYAVLQCYSSQDLNCFKKQYLRLEELPKGTQWGEIPELQTVQIEIDLLFAFMSFKN